MDEALLADVDRQRVASFQALEIIRRATFADIARERQAAIVRLGEEIARSLARVSQERVALTGDLPGVAAKATEQALPHAKQAIDHFFLRGLQLLAGLGITGVLAWLALARRSRRPSSRRQSS